jgi:ATP adenylyltransferase
MNSKKTEIASVPKYIDFLLPFCYDNFNFPKRSHQLCPYRLKMKQNLFVPYKLKYAKGERPQVDCILCAVKEKNPKVEKLNIFETERVIVTLNLYPYNPGHIMLFPKRHIITLQELTKKETAEIHNLTILSMEVLNQLYNPSGYNIGYNIGKGSGASIQHLHLHIVPRYENEIGFLDILSGTRIIVEDPVKTKEKLSRTFREKIGHVKSKK